MADDPTTSPTPPPAVAPSPSPRQSEPQVLTPVRVALEHARYLTLVAVLGLVVTAMVTFGLAGEKTFDLARHLLTGDWDDNADVVLLLEAIDTYLLAVVQLIVAVGLYELFVGDLDVPDWLEIHSLDDLKKALVDVLILFVAVKGVEKLLSAKDPQDALYATGAVAVLMLALTAYRTLKSKH